MSCVTHDPLDLTSKLFVQCTDNVVMFYVNLFLENIVHIL